MVACVLLGVDVVLAWSSWFCLLFSFSLAYLDLFIFMVLCPNRGSPYPGHEL